MALVDANYCFIFIDIGNYGSNANGTVFSKSEFGQMYLEEELDIPGPKPLQNAPDLGNVPNVIVADEAFPLKAKYYAAIPKSKKWCQAST